MKPLKIALVTTYPPSKGSLNEYAYHLVQQMKHKDEIGEIVILSDQIGQDESFKEENGRIQVRFRETWKFNSLFNLWNILKAIRQEKPDIVLYNLQFLTFGDKKIQATLGLFAPFLTRLMGVVSVALLHNITETVDLESAGITKNPLLKKFYALTGTILTRIILGANLVAVTIPKYVKILEDKYKADNVALIPHGSFELPAMPDFDTVNKTKKVMTFGKFGTYKLVEPMIEAVEIVRQRTDLEIEAVIAGTDSPNRKGYLDGVKEQYSHVKGLRFTGYVEEEDVPVIFGESDVCVFPYSSTTGSSGVLHQAGSYGKAAILPNIGDLKALVEEEGYNGAFFKPGDVEDLADAIEELLTNDDKRNTIARQNYSAAAGLPMSDIVDWYLIHFTILTQRKRNRKSMGQKLREVGTAVSFSPRKALRRAS